MRILHIMLGRCNPDSANGVDKAIFHLSRYCAKNGCEVAVFQVTAKQLIPIPRVETKYFAPSWIGLGGSKELMRAIKSWAPDVVHLHSVFTPLNLWVSTQLLRHRIPYVVTPHGGYANPLHGWKRILRPAIVGAFEKPLLNHALFIHAVGLMDQISVRALGVKAPVVMIPNGVPDEDMDRTEQGSKEQVILCFGRIDIIQKGLDLLLEGFAKSGVGKRGWTLRMVGPATSGEIRRINKIIHQYGLRNTAKLVPPAFGESKWKELGTAKIFIQTSRSEGGTSISALEAMIARSCCILTEPANPLTRTDWKGLLVQTDMDPSQIGRDLAEVCSWSDERRALMGRMAGDYVRQNFSWSGSAATLAGLYEDRLRVHGSSGGRRSGSDKLKFA